MMGKGGGEEGIEVRRGRDLAERVLGCFYVHDDSEITWELS